MIFKLYLQYCTLNCIFKEFDSLSKHTLKHLTLLSIWMVKLPEGAVPLFLAAIPPSTVQHIFWPLRKSLFDPCCPSIRSSVCLSRPSVSFHLYLSVKVCHGLQPLPYVTGAHIRENNLWGPWIRDAVEFPMIQVWYGNSLKYLDSRGLSDQCSLACCWQTHVSETSCQENPRGPGREERTEKAQRNEQNLKKKLKECEETERNGTKKWWWKCSLLFFGVSRQSKPHATS